MYGGKLSFWLNEAAPQRRRQDRVLNRKESVGDGLQGAMENPLRGRMYHLIFQASSTTPEKTPLFAGL
ncbi:hypothetical protein PSCICO_36030 [Pseudomonas cichorii]|nr:hypothetical protein PSCICN_12540 [Pseudomonas cichorii]GFM88204.1 hypothetical protein PSCICO_36030 [Pseudomonas cichorii]